MSDILGSLGGSSSRPTDALVEAYKRTQQQPIQSLKQQKTKLERRQVFFTSLRTRLESLSGSVSGFTDSTESISKFRTKKSTSSDTAVASVSASSTAAVGVSTLKVNRLASNDILASDRKTLTDASGYTAGTKTFDITINGTTSTVSVTFDGTEDNDAALTKIAGAINETTDIGVTAGFIKDTSTTGRLTLSSKSTGGDNRITFTDTDNVLSQIGITAALTADPANRTVFTASNAGYLKADSSELNAQFQVNGVDVVRGSNSVSDVLEGLTFTLVKAQDASAQPITLTTSVDEQGVVNNVNPLLDAFNAVVEHLNSDATTYKDDFAVRSFRSNLRQVSSSEFSAGAYKYLSDVGVTADDNGKLTVSDTTKLQDAIRTNSEDVALLFEEFSKRLDSTIEGLLGDDGLIDSRSTSISSQIKNISSRTSELEKRVDAQAEALRRQYETIMDLYIKAEQQFTLLGGLQVQ